MVTTNVTYKRQGIKQFVHVEGSVGGGRGREPGVQSQLCHFQPCDLGQVTLPGSAPVRRCWH